MNDSKLRDISGLWIAAAKKTGEEYFFGYVSEKTGDLNLKAGIKLLVFKNKNKREPKHPDFTLSYVEELPEEESGAEPPKGEDPPPQKKEKEDVVEEEKKPEEDVPF